MDERRDDWDRDGGSRPGDEPRSVDERSAVETASLLIGAVAHTVQKAGPETTEHLVRAGHELMLAVRALVRHFAEAVTEAPSVTTRDEIEHISISGSPAEPRPRQVGAAEPQQERIGVPGEPRGADPAPERPEAGDPGAKGPGVKKQPVRKKAGADEGAKRPGAKRSGPRPAGSS